jgi:hypothetical protein
MPPKKVKKVVPGAGGAAAKPKKGVKGGAKGAKGKGGKKKKKIAGPEDIAAILLQKITRIRLAKIQLAKLKAEKEAMEKEMERLEKEAFMADLAYQRKKEEKQRKKEKAAREKRERKGKVLEELFDAAFDGELELVQKCLSDEDAGLKVDEVRGDGNTPLLEAAAGTSGENIAVMKYLLEKGADVNKQGQHKRTSLWRASFAGNLEAVKFLTEQGGDPRIADKDGEPPMMISKHNAAIKTFFEEWDMDTVRTRTQMINVVACTDATINVER